MNRRSTTPLLLTAAAFAVPFLLSACGDDEVTSVADTTPVSASSSAAPLTTDVLLTDDDTVYAGDTDWWRTTAAAGDGQDAFNLCAQQSLTGLGAVSVVRGDFELRAADAPDSEITGDSLVEVVGEFEDHEAAVAAWSTVSGWLEECDDRPAELTDYRALQTRKVSVEGADAVITDSHLGPVPAEVDEFGDAAYIMETGLAVSGNHLVVLTSVIIGQDYNFLEEEGGTPVNRMLPIAVDRVG